jgi:hypothetical protein
MRKTLFATLALLCTAVLSATPQQNISDEAGRVLALEKAWNLALEEKNTKALDMLLANTMQSIDIDGSIASKSEFLASIKSPDYQPSQAITEQSNVQIYGNTAVVVGIFRVKGISSWRGRCFLFRWRPRPFFFLAQRGFGQGALGDVGGHAENALCYSRDITQHRKTETDQNVAAITQNVMLIHGGDVFSRREYPKKNLFVGLTVGWKGKLIEDSDGLHLPRYSRASFCTPDSPACTSRSKILALAFPKTNKPKFLNHSRKPMAPWLANTAAPAWASIFACVLWN